MVLQKRIKQLLDYDPETGLFRHKIPGSKPIAGDLNGDGYRTITVDGFPRLAHRLAFVFMTGSEPDDEVDHINLDKSDNRWVNLRPATRSQNMRNRGVSANSVSRIKGVSAFGNGFRFRIRAGGKRIEVCGFKTAEAAAAGYAEAARLHHGEFARAA